MLKNNLLLFSKILSLSAFLLNFNTKFKTQLFQVVFIQYKNKYFYCL